MRQCRVGSIRRKALSGFLRPGQEGLIAHACTWRQPQPREPCRVMQGHTLADRILSDVQTRARAISEGRGSAPRFAILTMGLGEASQKYIRVKEKTARCLGIDVYVECVSGNTTADLATAIDMLNTDSGIDSFIVQLPLPPSVDLMAALDRVLPSKDADGLGARTRARLAQPREALGEDTPDFSIALSTPHAFVAGMDSPLPTPRERWGQARTLYPCTPLAAMALLAAYRVSVAGKRAVVLGQSILAGLPLSKMLEASGALVTSCDASTCSDSVAQALTEADVVVCAIGKPRWLTGNMLKRGVVVLDIGVNMLPRTGADDSIDAQPVSFEERLAQMDQAMVQKSIPLRAFDCVDGAAADQARGLELVGDVDAYSVRKVANMLTPVPGGVGPVTVAMLMRNVVMSAEARMAPFGKSNALCTNFDSPGSAAIPR